jgi:hypothetical protein
LNDVSPFGDLITKVLSEPRGNYSAVIKQWSLTRIGHWDGLMEVMDLWRFFSAPRAYAFLNKDAPLVRSECFLNLRQPRELRVQIARLPLRLKHSYLSSCSVEITDSRQFSDFGLYEASCLAQRAAGHILDGAVRLHLFPDEEGHRRLLQVHGEAGWRQGPFFASTQFVQFVLKSGGN